MATEKDQFNYSLDLDADKIDISFSAQDLDSMLSGSMSQYTYTTNNTGGAVGAPYYTINTSGTGANWNYGNITINSTTPTQTGLHVTSDAEFEGDIRWKGRSLGKLLEDIEKRLAILVPDPEKLKHFEALKKAYDHYKMLEALCELPKKEEK